MTAPEKQIHIPTLCAHHRHDMLAKRLRIPKDGPWPTHEVAAMILLFQGASADDRIWARAEGNAANLSLVLNEVGCLACWDGSLYERVCRVMQRGLSHAADVTYGRVADEGFDFRRQPHQERP